MKIIKTYWDDPDGPDRRPYYLTIRREPLYLFGLSSLLLLKHHTVELYTDAAGARIIDSLSIPFAKINVVDKLSASYKSVNDLHVLSLQAQPAVLVDDTLLTMGKIDLSCKPGALKILGIDLNSIKLVKALIKTMRINTTIPLLDDTLWQNKMAYIDTALIGIENNALIKDYLTEVQQFIHNYAAGLSKIDNAVIEDFFKRYWLYSYCTAKGAEFDSYFKDPMEVIQRTIDQFGFSTKNVTQDLLKVRDHYFSDPVFSLHLLRYFRLHFPDTFQAIRLLEKRLHNNNGKTASYPRTRQLYQRMYPETVTPAGNGKTGNVLSLQNIKASMSKRPADDRMKLLKDVYHFEKNVSKVHKHYLAQSDAVRKQQNTAFEKILQYWDAPEEVFNRLKIAVNPFFYFTETDWKWNTRWVEGVAVEKVAALKVIYNSSVDPAYFIAGFIPDQERDTAFEFNIDKISAEIIDHFSKESTISDFTDHLLSHKAAIPAADEHIALKQLYHYRIKDLLLINILQINA
ncbi:DUF6734 family protein [Longitalea luteola]|uniref:DUF6734 family protein n=1 Tax=Longitalea luteola TaxID=2812563 RepID=UPI001A96445B|nr:DUF6734 family protein [Longitalea luteola]